ncbi:winged helix-turn-helix domain-containing protein [Streptomyces sp. BH106]|uniref:winged helix-turn-helix domain-containing protein n=1 Tax=Streptomyces sp. BH106 TaxID=3410409 RepID=UPI003CF38A6E
MGSSARPRAVLAVPPAPRFRPCVSPREERAGPLKPLPRPPRPSARAHDVRPAPRRPLARKEFIMAPALLTDPLISVDTACRTVHVAGRQLDLTYLEFELLAHLVGHPHRVHTRDTLVHTVWGYGHVGDGRTVDVHVARLRRKLGAEYRDTIRTVRRVGYKYTPPTGS